VRRWLVTMMAPALVVLGGCTGQDGAPAREPSACGWDLTTAEGRSANLERLTFLDQWLTDHPGVPVPEPTSPAWRGECPTPTGTPPAPPEHEDEAPAY
jgi:hypothetical protein